MAIAHAVSGRPVSVLPYGAGLTQQQSTALFKTERLEVMRLVLPRGKSMPSHKVAGAITVQCLEGVIAFASDDSTQTLRPGDLVYLEGGVTHSITGVEDASALVTMALCR
ncbi:MAG: cupin domain-containing protein [Rhodoferax sp.]